MSFLAATTLAGQYRAAPAIAAGVIGGLVFLVIVYMGLGLGMTRMNFLTMLGTMFAPEASSGVVYALGFAVHMMMSAVFGLVDAGILTAIGATSVGQAAGWGLALGAAHGAVVLAAMPMILVAMHPLVRRGELAAPGVALTGYGSGTPVGSFMAHVAFGLVAAVVYAAVVL